VPASSSTTWLLLIHQIPTKPDYLRVKIGRRLHRLGAVGVKSSVYVAPAVPAMRTALAATAREIHQRGGEAVVCEARFIEGLADGAVEDLFRGARDAEYLEIGQEARRIASAMRGARVRDDARRRPIARKVERLRIRFEEIVARDRFGARGRETAARALSLAEDRLEGVELSAKREAASSEMPRGAAWITRTGVMVDRIASAWLIRRFIDPNAVFRFVAHRGYRMGRGEIPFDMAGAEFTHRDGRCTFEVLMDHFRIRDSGLKPIAEIVHDLDLEDRKYGRPEAAGVDRMILGLAIARQNDAARLAQGGTMFDNLYESFRRGSRSEPEPRRNVP
jgi:hypothetical protein